MAVASETREGGEAARAAGVAIADAVASLLVAFTGSEVHVRGSLRGSFGGESVALDGEVGSCVMREQCVSVKRCHFGGDGLEDVSITHRKCQAECLSKDDTAAPGRQRRCR